ncbi:MAG: hypothetical protein K0U74_05595 [Alphaproteobacteria bacterium]|nr:hypothetical protein [Alphaproteobacteria bacterium]
MFLLQKATDWIGIRFGFLQRLQGSLLLSPVILTCMLVFALLEIGQFKEILVYAVEASNVNCAVHVSAGFASLALLSTTLFFGYLSACVVLRKAGIGYGSSLSYKTEVELQRDRRIVWLRNFFALACASGPLLAVGFVFRETAFAIANTSFKNTGSHVDLQSIAWLSPDLCAPIDAGTNLAQHLLQLGNLWVVLSLIFLFFLFLSAHCTLVWDGGWWRFWTWRLQPCQTRTRRGVIISVLSLAILLVPLPLMQWAATGHDSVYVWLGPLATLGLVLAATAWLLFVIGEGSKKSGIPVFLVLSILVFGFGLITWTQRGAVVARLTEQESAGAGELNTVFAKWLKARNKKLKQATQEPFPVYIVAAPGGGIYAAAYVTSVMAHLEARCPGFTQHVFAISAVSGGAIGSTIVNAVSHGELRNTPVKCGNISKKSKATQAGVKKIISQDHLSPTLGTTVPDVIWKLGQIFFYEAKSLLGLVPSAPKMTGGRAEALERSFSRALKIDGGKHCLDRKCGYFEEGFSKHFDAENDRAPALLLNTTWAETGARITFAPFSLNGVGDDTLLAMQDLKGAKEPKLIEAAIASARFPAVLPAKVLYPEGKLWWNFVDGGYADASGTTTALELYNELSGNKIELEKQAGRNFILKLIIITESDGDIGFSNENLTPSGAGLIHAISPITTLLTIREQMGRRAVARALKELKELRLEKGNVVTPCWKVVRISLDPRELDLPLGWLLSKNTVEAIDQMMVMKNAMMFQNIESSLVDPEKSCSDDAPTTR